MIASKLNQLRFILVLAFISGLGFAQCTSKKTAFLAFGDSGMGSSMQVQVADTMVNFCAENRCDFVTLLGDNIYPNGVKSAHDPQWKTKFEEPYQGLDINFYPTLGNHDYFGNVEAQFEYSQVNPKWKFPERFYSFSECFVEFFVIDAERFDQEQALWIQEAIALSKAKWKIVVGHRPVFSHGGHGDTEVLKEALLPLIKNKVDFYL
ncbi:MAG: metallophosphoesterase, partial [Pseudomonadota bacterium]